jgi:16S rRNA U516 pseudouridylate synthase RsuA-like enzyme
MNLLQFLQRKGFSRRKILDSLLKELVFINGKKVTNLKEPLEIGDRVQYLEHKYVVEQQDVSEEDQILILFNKPQ